MGAFTTNADCGVRLRIIATPMADAQIGRVSRIKSSDHLTDPWTRPVREGDICIHSAPDHLINLPKRQFHAWFSMIDSDQCRGLPISFAFQISSCAYLRPVHPAVPFSLLSRGESMLIGMSEEGHLLMGERTLIVSYYLHGKRHKGLLLVPETQYKEYAFPVVPLGQWPDDAFPEPVQINSFLAYSRSRYRAIKITRPDCVRTMFGDPAAVGDAEVQCITENRSPLVVPSGLQRLWFTTVIENAHRVVKPLGEFHILQPTVQFALSFQDREVHGDAGDCIVTGYDPWGIVAPCVMKVPEVIAKYKLAGGSLG